MNNLKAIRQSQDLTQTELAQKIGTSKQYICQLESGNREILRIRTDTMQRLCKALNCSMEDLLASPTFEFDKNDFLYVDCLYRDKYYPDKCIVQISSTYYSTPSICYEKSGKKVAAQLCPMQSSLSDRAKEVGFWEYPMHCMIKKEEKLKMTHNENNAYLLGRIYGYLAKGLPDDKWRREGYKQAKITPMESMQAVYEAYYTDNNVMPYEISDYVRPLIVDLDPDWKYDAPNERKFFIEGYNYEINKFKNK